MTTALTAQPRPRNSMRGGYSYLTASRLLAQGARPPVGVRLPFDVIVLAAWEYQPEMPGYDVIHVPLDDEFELPVTKEDRTRIQATARAVARHVRAGRRVLVTCHQGRNRSGVIAGLALVELGMPRNQAVRLIRTLRNGLTNPHFYDMVKGTPPPEESWLITSDEVATIENPTHNRRRQDWRL